MLNTIIKTVFLSIIPISELRGAIPFAFFNDIPLSLSFIIAVVSNCMVFPICLFFLNSVHRILLHIGIYERFFEKVVQKAQKQISDKVSKFGIIGLALFVGIPLPITGAWTATLGAWILNLDKKKSFAAVCLGVLMAGLIISTIVITGSGVNSIFIKKI